MPFCPRSANAPPLEFTGKEAGAAPHATMKPEGHPNYDFVTVTMTDGTTYRTRSTMGGPGKTLNLDIDPKSHPAWTGGNATMLDRGGRVSRFNDKFKGFFKK